MSGSYAVIAGPLLIPFALVTQAMAAQFTFHVPVRIENATPLTRAQVACTVFDTRGSMGSGRSPIPLSSGVYDGTVTVAFDLAADRSPLAARTYHCTIELWARDRGGFEFFTGYMGIEEDYPSNTGQDLVELVPVVRGDLPR